MPKTNDIHSKAHRSKGSDKKKNTFKKYGKNTTRGIRIKLADMINENKAKKNESNRGFKNKNKIKIMINLLKNVRPV